MSTYENLMSPEKPYFEPFLKVGFGNAQVVVGAYLEQSLPIFIHFAHTKLT